MERTCLEPALMIEIHPGLAHPGPVVRASALAPIGQRLKSIQCFRDSRVSRSDTTSSTRSVHRWLRSYHTFVEDVHRFRNPRAVFSLRFDPCACHHSAVLRNRCAILKTPPGLSHSLLASRLRPLDRSAPFSSNAVSVTAANPRPLLLCDRRTYPLRNDRYLASSLQTCSVCRLSSLSVILGSSCTSAAAFGSRCEILPGDLLCE